MLGRKEAGNGPGKIISNLKISITWNGGAWIIGLGTIRKA
jgi:hypothetical protein